MIPHSSELQEIGSYAFAESSIESIFIPSHVATIGKSVFEFCQKLQIIEISENSAIQLDVIVLCIKHQHHKNDIIVMTPLQNKSFMFHDKANLKQKIDERLFGSGD